MLAPGDPVGKLVERSVISEAAQARDRDMVRLVEGGAVLAGQVVALCLGAPVERVEAVGRALSEVRGGERDGE